VIQLGVEPYRIDLLTSVSGLDFEQAWSDRASGTIDGIPVNFLTKRAFRINKSAAGSVGFSRFEAGNLRHSRVLRSSTPLPIRSKAKTQLQPG
jgi:hypothetical protein